MDNTIKLLILDRDGVINYDSDAYIKSIAEWIPLPGAIEAIVCLKAINDGFLPATINYQIPDEELDLDYVPNQGREAEVNVVLSNSLGFGGHNGTLLFKKYR